MHQSGIPELIPPGTVVRLVKADRNTPTWSDQVGHRFIVGYYSRQDGLDVIWLIDELRKTFQTTDRNFLLRYFEIEQLGHSVDAFGPEERER